MIKIIKHRVTRRVLLTVSYLMVGSFSASGQNLELLQSKNLFNRVQEGDGLRGLTDENGSATDGQFKSVLFFGAAAPFSVQSKPDSAPELVDIKAQNES